MAEFDGMTYPPREPPAGPRSVTILCWVLGMPLIMAVVTAGAYAVYGIDLFLRWL